MREPVDLLREAREIRALAARERKNALASEDKDERERLLRHAAELRQRAVDIEKQAEAARGGPSIF